MPVSVLSALWALLLALPVWVVMFFYQSPLMTPTLCPSPELSWWYLLLVAPVLEEAAFRGFIQEGLGKTTLGKRRVFGLSGANFVTSFLFVGAHSLRIGITAVTVLPPSLILGWVKDRSGSTTACIAVHMIYNAGLVVVLNCTLNF
jgi:membrane protease YdiL (CAAX protease family)